MPKARPIDPLTSKLSKSSRQPLALRIGGARYSRPVSPGTGNRRFVLVAIDYFTKWAETEALANIRDVDVKKFVWRNIVTRFGVSDSLVSDNGLQFDSKAFHEFCSHLGIKKKNIPLRPTPRVMASLKPLTK